MENDEILNIFSLVDKDIVQKLQDFFAQTLDLAFLCIYKDIFITQLSGEADFCNIIKERNKGFCNNCLLELTNMSLNENRTIIKKCHLGLTHFSIPISINGKYMLSVIGGQILTEPLDEVKFKENAAKLGLNIDEYLGELNNIKVIPIEKLTSLTELLKIMANLLAAISYSNYQLSQMGVDYKIPTNIALKEWYEQSYCTQENLISAREREVLKLVIQGKSNNEIADELFISVHTAKSHVSSILEKCQVEDRVQLAVKAVRDGLL